ncbi:SDR family oxidoreductase [Pelagibacteraceae bacterium]|jgi:NAD(P)-dependent dehydrogenase (short-subunit alcohol dehydrogenase family)|nr:SDR family oxidoreductase [Pelagibacteraceae bacterium]MDC1158123.1 SDR family oxidoreductase [Pelagibacteraceae bacterium]
MMTSKIIITGGATRIGAAIAKSLANYETAITIHYNKSKVNALKLKKELENLGSEVYLLKADLNNFKQTQILLKLAYKKMNGLDCLINNASLFENDNLQNFTNKSFTKHLNINLKAPAILIQNFKKLLKNSEGNIINIIDQRVEKLTPYFFSYTLSKSSLVTLTKTAAMKLAPNIRINGISPGPTVKNSRQSETHFKKQWKSVLLKKKVELENICDGIKFLIKNTNVTGEIINIDSGQRLAWNTPDIINVKE